MPTSQYEDYKAQNCTI